MRIAPVSPISAAIQAQALAAVEGALTAGLGGDARIEAVAEARLGASAAGTATVAAAPDPAAAAPPPAPADPARAAVDQAKASAAASQASLAPMFADMAAALNAPATPPQLRAALANVLSLRTPVGAAFTGEQLHQAVVQSGVMLEAKLAAGLPPGRDLKAALLTLLSTLKSLPPAAAPDAPLPPLAQNAGGLPEAPREPADTPRAADRPPPPLRDGTLRAQPVESSSLPAARAADVAPRLIADVEHAVARQVLHQIASLPQGREAQDGPAWMFELPLLTPQGATLAQFAVERDGRGGGAAGEGGPTWRARFALDVEPLGPLHVDLRMGGAGRSRVTMWGGQTAMAQLAPDADLLGRMLDADVALHPGAPAEGVPAAPGQFVDRTS